MSERATEEETTEPNDGGGAVAWLPDLIYTGSRFASGLALVCDEAGRILRLSLEEEITCRIVRLNNRALLPGLVNAHSHAFQRVIRGRTERRGGVEGDNFWSWREMMYSAATRLSPVDIYDASRMAFLEMASGGITAVGEFHYLHRTSEGHEYDDPNLLAKEVIRAARDVGLRIALLRVAYARSGYLTAPNEKQARFIEAEPEVYLRHVERLQSELSADDGTWVGVAPHSVRAVPLSYLREVIGFASAQKLPIHMHVAEQPAEIAACLEEHGRTPVALLDAEGLLGERFTGVHGIHITDVEARLLARARSLVCACPTTERNLGDGIIKTDLLFREGVRVSLGTDSHAQIDLLEDARELEYHLRLQKLERAVLSEKDDESLSSLAARLFDCATRNGAHSIGASTGALELNRPADFFTIDINDLSIAGASLDELLACVVFSLARTAVRDVCVGGKLIIEDGRHALEREIVERFAALQRKLWN
ncbi:MAG TPA: formimidoylglutamate deiminase [Pyrinomonadaceae bacterium]|jgi:formimidoylglutamate deiminase